MAACPGYAHGTHVSKTRILKLLHILQTDFHSKQMHLHVIRFPIQELGHIVGLSGALEQILPYAVSDGISDLIYVEQDLSSLT